MRMSIRLISFIALAIVAALAGIALILFPFLQPTDNNALPGIIVLVIYAHLQTLNCAFSLPMEGNPPFPPTRWYWVSGVFNVALASLLPIVSPAAQNWVELVMSVTIIGFALVFGIRHLSCAAAEQVISRHRKKEQQLSERTLDGLITSKQRTSEEMPSPQYVPQDAEEQHLLNELDALFSGLNKSPE